MASDAGQGIPAIEGAEEEETKQFYTLPPGPRTPYELVDSFSPWNYPPALTRSPETDPAPYREGSSSLDPDLAVENSDYADEVIRGAIEFLKFFGAKAIRDTPIFTMAQTQLLFVDGTFAELAQEMADYMQIGDQVKPYLEKEDNEEALQIIVKASSFLNSVPEKEFTGAYNLLIHLVLQSKDPVKLLPAVCGNLMKPITSSPANGFTLAANALSTIFNLIEPRNPLRFNVLMQIIRFVRQHGQFDVLKPRLKNLEGWFADWETEAEQQRNLYVQVSEAAADAGDDE
jgi:translation initiation factor 3 subunit M